MDDRFFKLSGSPFPQDGGGYGADVQFSSAQLLTMYRTSWVAGRGIRAPAEDATRNWRKWRATAEQITKLEAEEKRLGLKSKVEQAIVSARLFGGSAIYINTGVAEQDAPVKEGEKIITLAVLGCNILQPGPNSADIFSQYYGKPEYYTVTNSKTSGQVRIHASRLAVFYGNALPVGADSLSSEQWGDSVLKTVYDAVTQRDSTVANIASLVFEAKIDVFKFSGFADLLAAGGDDILVSRLQTQAAMKGINGAVVLDSQDDYQTKGASFGALPELMTRFQEEAAGAFEMPVTRLFGRSVAGLSGSGDGDERVYYDTISNHQNTQITPASRHAPGAHQ
jgi:phage-related protein (TIGR01555 family)